MCPYRATLSLIAIVLCGCSREPAKVPMTQMVTSLGTNYDPITGWTIRVSQADGIHIGPRTQGGLVKWTSTVSPSNWRPHSGWFAFAENEERVWIFDGERDFTLLNATPKVWSLRTTNFGCTVPQDVKASLPPRIRSQIRD